VGYAARRLRRYAAWLLVPLAGAGCAAPQFSYATDGPAKTYFKVPYGWHKIDDSSLAKLLSGSGFPVGSGFWDAGYDAGGPVARDVFSTTVTKPAALAFVEPLSQQQSSAMSYNQLRDLVLPVTSTARQAAAQRGSSLTGFQLVASGVIAPGGGVHGIREVFSYTFPGGQTDTFDQVALTNSDDTMVYLLLVHCRSSCYSRNFSQIDTVMKSFTVRSP
jgi:hypothetical protein